MFFLLLSVGGRRWGEQEIRQAGEAEDAVNDLDNAGFFLTGGSGRGLSMNCGERLFIRLSGQPETEVISLACH
jgi:hypothetical protein